MNSENTETKKRRPRWPRALAGLVVFLAVLLLVLQYALGPIVKTTAEQLGPKVLGTRVDVTNAHMRILSGLVRLDGVVVGPPEGFDANVFEMQNFRVDLDTASLLGGADEPIVVRDITIEGPFVTYELKGLRDNLHALLSSLGADDDGEERQEDEEEKETPEEKKEGGRKVVIEHFLFKDAQVRVAVAGGKGAVVPLPDIELKDIGRSSGGATALDATCQILRQITLGTVVAAKDVLVDLGAAAVDAVGDAAGAAADAVGDAAGAAADAVGDAAGAAADAVTGAIGSLFGGDDDKKPEEP